MPEIDKSTWPLGPWNTEPDELRWESHGLVCKLVRKHWGHWCGYVQVPKGNRFSFDVLESTLSVHSGVTFKSKDLDGELIGVGMIWLGWDAAHFGDYIPGVPSFRVGSSPDTYRDLDYCKRETEKLARQIANERSDND